MAAITAATLAAGAVLSSASAAGGLSLAAGGVAALAGGAAFAAADFAQGKIKDIFSPDLPEDTEITTPDPIAQASSLAAGQSSDNALRNRKGLRTTKVVQQSLLRQSGRSSLGGTSV